MPFMAGVNDVLRQLDEVEQVPRRAMEGMDTLLQSRLPVFTGTLTGSIEFVEVEDENGKGWALRLTEEALLSAASTYASQDGRDPQLYVYGVPSQDKPPFHLLEGNEPYPIRIEEQGSPKGKGRGAWGEVEFGVKVRITKLLMELAGQI